MTTEPVQSPLLSAAGITAGYGSRVVVRQLTFDVMPGQLTAIVGPSGCGKTTALLSLSGLLPVFEGTRTLAQGLTDRGLIYFSQQDTLLPWLSLRQNVSLGWDLLSHRSSDMESLERWLREFSIMDFADRSVRELSGGMRKRVCLARGFHARPTVALLDEPFNNLDLVDRARLEGFLRKWVGEAGAPRAVVCVTHDVAQALSIADQIGCFHVGPVGRQERILAFEVAPVPESLRPLDPEQRRAQKAFLEAVGQLSRKLESR